MLLLGVFVVATGAACPGPRAGAAGTGGVGHGGGAAGDTGKSCPPPAHTLPVDGAALHVELYGAESGSKPVVIFVHGWAHDGSMFYRQVAALRERFTVVTYDLRGHGDSVDSSHAGGDLATHAKDLEALITTLGRPVHLVGHDLGAAIALRVTLDHPAQVLSLTLLGPALAYDPGVQKAFAQLAGDFAADPASYRSWSGRLALAWIGDAYLEAHPELVDYLDAVMERHDHPSVVGTLVACLSISFSDEELAKLTTPTLVVYGADEHWPGSRESEERLARLPVVTPLRIPRASHEVYLEAADSLDAALVRHMGTGSTPSTH